MIKILRRKSSQKYIVLVAAIFIIPGFMLFGINIDPSNMPKLAGHMGKTKVSTQDFIRHHTALRRELQLFHGINPQALAENVDFEELTWQRALLVKAAESQKLKVSDAEVIDWLKSQKVFFTNGAFDPDFYRQVLTDYFKTSTHAFEEDTREFLALRAVRDMMRGNVIIEEDQARDLFKKQYAPRTFEYLLVNKEALTEEIPAPTEKELAEYYEWIKPRLYSPELVQVRYVAREALNEEEWHTFEPFQTGFIARVDSIPGIGFSEELTNLAFGLKAVGDKSDWTAFKDKEYQFELIKKQASAPMSFEDAENILISDLSKKNEKKAIYEKAVILRESAKDRSLSQLASDNATQFFSAENIKREDYVEKVGKYETLASALENLKENEISNPVEITNGFVIAQMKSIGDIDEVDWLEKKESVTTQLRFQREVEIFKSNMQKLEATLRINPDTMKALFPQKYTAESTLK